MKKLYIGFIALFLAIIVFPSAFIFLTPDNEFSDNENRMLQTAPTLNLDTVLDGSFQSSLSKYLSDQFPARDMWTEIGSALKLTIGFRDIGGAYIGSDGYYIEKITQNGVDSEKFADNLGIIKSFIDDMGIDGTVALVPSAGTVLCDKLPANAEMYDAEALYASACEILGNDVFLPDLYSELSAHSDEYIFYRTDHHWTTQGAYLAYNAIMQGNGKYTDELSLVSENFLGTTYSKTLDPSAKPDSVYIAPVSDSVSVYADGEDIEVYNMAALDAKDKYTVFFGGNKAQMVISGGAQNGKTLLIVKDSFANSLAPFLTADYENIIMLDLRYYNGSVRGLVATAGVTDFLFLGEMSNLSNDANMFKLMF